MNNGPYRPRPQPAMSGQYGGTPMFSQGGGMGPPPDPTMFSQGEGAAGLPPGGPAGAAAAGVPAPQSPQGNSGISMADAAAITGLNQLGAERGNVERQRKLADMLRTSGQKGMEGQQAGRVYKAPNALNLIGSLAGSFGGAYLDDQARAQAMDIGQREGEGAQRLFGMMRGGGGAPGGGSGLPGLPGAPGGPLSPDWSGDPGRAAFKPQGFGEWAKQGWQGLWGGGGS